jgi:hypothetical protein
MLVALNFSAREQEVSLPAGKAEAVLSTRLDREGPVDQGGVRLRPSEGLLLRERR